jgi:hypothetical protein
VRVIVLGLTLSLACGTHATGEVSPTPRASASTSGLPKSPLGSPLATGSPVRSASPSLPPGEAALDVHVIDGSSLTPVGNALVRVDPYGSEVRTDATGSAQLAHLAVSGVCRWVTISVTAAGFGKLEVVDEPLYPRRATFDARLTANPQRSYIGPPSGTAEGMNMCTR